MDRAIGRVVLRAAADPELLAPMFTEIHIWRAREADFEVGGRRQGVFAHDWRAESAPDWFRLKAERAGRISAAPSVGQLACSRARGRTADPLIA